MTAIEPSTTFTGQALSWSLRGTSLEVALHRAPCNEIGSVALVEYEQLAALLRVPPPVIRSLVFHSLIPAGFCAGADLKELYEGIQHSPGRTQDVRNFLDRIHAAFDTIDQAPVTTIAATHGVVFGGGLEVALTCDVIIADRSSRFSFPELRLGLVPGFGGIPRLRRDLGNAVVRDLLLSGRSLGASRAHQVGLVAQLVARGEALKAARALADQAARFDATTTAKAKAFLKQIPSAELAREKDLFCELFASPVVLNALDKFVRASTNKEVRPYLP